MRDGGSGEHLDEGCLTAAIRLPVRLVALGEVRRTARETLRVARADVRRALFGAPREEAQPPRQVPDSVKRRPPGHP
jgi:hypothetical protein